MFQSQEKLGRVEPASLLVEALLLLQVVEQLTTIDEPEKQAQKNRLHFKNCHLRKHKIQLLFGLETKLERHDERVGDTC